MASEARIDNIKSHAVPQPIQTPHKNAMHDSLLYFYLLSLKRRKKPQRLYRYVRTNFKLEGKKKENGKKKEEKNPWFRTTSYQHTWAWMSLRKYDPSDAEYERKRGKRRRRRRKGILRTRHGIRKAGSLLSCLTWSSLEQERSAESQQLKYKCQRGDSAKCGQISC